MSFCRPIDVNKHLHGLNTVQLLESVVVRAGIEFRDDNGTRGVRLDIREMDQKAIPGAMTIQKAFTHTIVASDIAAGDKYIPIRLQFERAVDSVVVIDLSLSVAEIAAVWIGLKSLMAGVGNDTPQPPPPRGVG